jgi:uncharacterized membrane protein YphA (DoxX/SURF4 family)
MIDLPKSAGGWFILIVRLIVGGLFIYASIDKILNPDQFAKILHNYRLVPPQCINLMAIIMPWIEFTAGTSLLLGFMYRGANLIIFSLLIVFTIALAINYIRGVNINCGCFSTSSSAKSDLLAKIIEDLLIMLGCVILMFKNRFVKEPGRS